MGETILEKPPPAPVIELDRRTYDQALGCIHCGLCLPACPTYLQTSNESDSPRGRIQLMRGLSDGVIAATPAVRHHLDLCLDCRACETACPSGVVYHELIDETRAKLAPSQPLPKGGRFLRWVFFHLLTHPLRMKIALLPVRLLEQIGLIQLLRNSGLLCRISPAMDRLQRLLPTGPLWPGTLPKRTPSSLNGTKEKEIGFFGGCVGSVLFGNVNQDAVDLLAASSSVVAAPRSQRCCGAIHLHDGDAKNARKLARKNIDAFQGFDVVTTTIGGCGAMLRDYATLMRDDPDYAERARQFSCRVRDISQVLAERKLPDRRRPLNITATYHDACHLAHGQRVTVEPRQLLGQIPGLKLVPLRESEICCGAAGTYNLTQPQMASALAERKLQNILATGASVCVMGNVGCAMHLSAFAKAKGIPLSIKHPVELLHEATLG